MSGRTAPETTPAAAPEPVDPAALQEIAQALAERLGLPVDKVTKQIARLAEGPKTPQERLLVRLNARYAGARIAPARRPRR
jgi:hypothetical protein